MYRDLLTQNRSRDLVSEFLDDFIQQRGWWAARAAWVSDVGMVLDPWRVSPSAPPALDPLRRFRGPVEPIDAGELRYPRPSVVPVAEVHCTRMLAEDFIAAGVDELIVVDVPGVGPFDLRLVFAVDAPLRQAPDGLEALRTGAALLPTLIRQEGERTALRIGALRDPLTGLLNRAGLDEVTAQRPDADRLRAVIYIDLDGFKAVNDAHGHAAGDQLLIDTSRRLAAQVRPDDLIARLGGDEFVIVAESVLDEPSVVSLSQRILSAVTRDLVLDSGAVASIAASAGVTLWPREDSLEATIALADNLMYEAKRIGGGIAMQDSSGRILVRDPLGGDAHPEEVERGRAPVRVLALSDLTDPSFAGAHVLLRGELSTRPATDAATEVVAALERTGLPVPPALLLEPRGRGWARDGVLGELVGALQDELTPSEVAVLIDSVPSAIELRLVVDELRAAGRVDLVLGGVGSVNGGEIRMIARANPAALSLDPEAALNLARTSPRGIVARLAAALGAVTGAPLLVIEPPAQVSDDDLRTWGVRRVARPVAS